MTESRTPEFAIVIPFIEWNAGVKESVDGCLALDYPNFTIVLAPNSADSVPAEYQQRDNIRTLSSETHGISHKRNLAIQNSGSADFIACIDSDAYPDPHWLSNALLEFERSEDIWVVGGPDMSPEYPELRRRAVANALKSYAVSGPRRFMKLSKESKFVDDLRTCNFIIRRSACDATGGFDETLEVGEDSALCGDVRRLGGKLYFSSKVKVYHHARSLFSPYLKQKVTTGYGVPKLLKHSGKEMSTFSILFRFVPAVTFLGLLLGWVTVFFSPVLFAIWASVAGLYSLILIVEALRLSRSVPEFFPTLFAILSGNLAPGVGTLIAYSRLRLNLRTFYKNYS